MATFVLYAHQTVFELIKKKVREKCNIHQTNPVKVHKYKNSVYILVKCFLSVEQKVLIWKNTYKL